MIFIRYVTIQLIAYGMDYGIFFALLHSGLANAIFANAIGKIISGCFSFAAHQRFTFRQRKDQADSKRPFRYFLLLGINVPISSAILSLLLLFIEWPLLAKIITDAACVSLNFWISKKWVFTSKGRAQSLEAVGGNNR